MRSSLRFYLSFAWMLCMALGLGWWTQAQAATDEPHLNAVANVEGVSEYRLDNGLRVILAPDESRSNTTVNMTYLVGARHENYGQTGMAHLLEHMLFRGTPDMPNALAEFSKRGLAANGTTSSDRTNYFATFAADEETLQWYLDWQADVMTNATISQEELDAEMTVVRNEMERGENSPFRVLMQKMQSAAFQWHNYGKSTIGARSDVEQVDVDQLRAFYKEYYQPDNAVLIVAGRFDPVSTLAHIQEVFSRIPKPDRRLKPEYTVEPVQDGPRMVTVKRQGGSPIVAAQYHIPAEASPEFIPLSLGVNILADTPSGRLYQALVENDLSTSVFGFAAGMKDPGYALFMAELKEGMDEDQALRAMNETLDEIRNHPFTEDELKRVRSQWLNAWNQAYADPSQLAMALSESAAVGDWRLFFWSRDQVENVQQEQVQEAVNRWFVPDNRTNGKYVPTEQPQRAPRAEPIDAEEMLADYQGKEQGAATDGFDPTPEAINAATQVKDLDLGNGNHVKIALLNKPTRGDRVYAELALRFGTPDELVGLRTVGAATASLLERGTTELKRQDISDRFNELQTDVSFDGTANGLNVSISTVREHLDDAVALVIEVIRNANFPERELEKYKSQRITAINNAKTEPMAVARQELARHFNHWPEDDIRYVPTFAEAIEATESLERQQLVDFHERFYGLGNIRFAATGAFDPDSIEKVLVDQLKDWRQAPAYVRADDEYQETPTEHFRIHTPDKANAFYMAEQHFPIQDTDADYVPLYLTNYLLGQSETSRLWNRVRVDEGLSYDVRSQLSVSNFEPLTRWIVYAIHAPENSQRLEEVIRDEIATTVVDGFSEEEVQSGIHALLRYRQLARSNDQNLTFTWMQYLALDRDFDWSAEIDAQLQRLDAKQVNEVLRKYLDLESWSTALGADEDKQNEE